MTRNLEPQPQSSRRVLRPCAQLGCPMLVGSAGRCANHRQQHEQARGSRQARGYDSTWFKFRAAYIAEVVAVDPFCEDCREPFVATRDIQLHHIGKISRRPELKLTPGNIRYLCARCHTLRTNRGE